MEKYDYYKAVEEDIRSYIEEWDGPKDYDTLYDAMWTSDGVTGNGSGSYTFNTWQAEENLCHNFDLLNEACNEFGCEAGKMLADGAEAADVTIRCYLLGQILNDVLVDYADEEDEDEEDDEES